MSAGSALNPSGPPEPIGQGPDGQSAGRTQECGTELTPRPTLLDFVLEKEAVAEAEKPKHAAADRRLHRFLTATSIEDGLLIWFDGDVPRTVEELGRTLNCDIAQIDELLNLQINAVIHHPAFQRIEASWRGLRYLVDRLDVDSAAKVRVLNVSWKEVSRDMERAIEFDQSQLFRKIYSEEFGVAGGEPFSVLIGDYEIRPFPSHDHPHDDISTLRGISQVAAAAFAPFITAPHPSMFGLDDFGTLERSINLNRVFDQTEFLPWRRFREADEDSRFIGLTLPRVLSRTPYEDLGLNHRGQVRVDSFRFQEDVSGPDRSKYLWGNASYAFAAVLVRSFQESGWLADIRGVRRGIEGGGLVTGLPVHCFQTDRDGVAMKSSTDVVITDMLEKTLGELGFIPLCQCQDTEYSAFYGNCSVQKPKPYDRLAATINARMTSTLQYTLCVSRFAHYLKVIGRDRVGSFAEASETERFLQEWLTKYVTVDDDASPQVKSRFPLREASVSVHEIPGQAGKYECVMHLRPHYELENLSAAVRLRSELSPV